MGRRGRRRGGELSSSARVKIRGDRKTPSAIVVPDSLENHDAEKPILTLETLRRLARIVEAIKQRCSEAASQSLAADLSGGHESLEETPRQPGGQDPAQQDGEGE